MSLSSIPLPARAHYLVPVILYIKTVAYTLVLHEKQ
jgi:hypothetical protein